MNKLKRGLTYISERTDQLRYSDKLQHERWLQPLSEYIPLEEIKRGQPVSIATADDIAKREKALGLTQGSLSTDSNTYIVLTDPQIHSHAVGLAYEYSAGVTIEAEKEQHDSEPKVLTPKKATLPDPIHVIGQGRFDINLDYLIKSHQKEELTDVVDKTEYVPDFFLNYHENIGKTIWVKGGDTPGLLTIVEEEAYLGYRNIIQIGFISDAWILSNEEVEELAKKDSVSIEVQIDGDNRGALDSTQYEGILGEDVIIPEDDPVRVFALGQEEDVAFEGRINITPSTIRNVDTKTAFIGIQKMDGKTSIITFGDDFSVDNVKSSGVTDDIAFIHTAELYNKVTESETDIQKAQYFNDVGGIDRTLSDCIQDTQNSLKVALQNAFNFVSGSDLEITCLEDFNKLSTITGFIKFKATTPGGYYYLYISENMYDHLSNSTVYHNGSSLNKGTVVLADCRIKERQNLIGIYNSGKHGLLKKGTKCIFLREGLFVHKTDKYNAIGEAYYLFQNGRVTRYQFPGADTINKILTVQDDHKLLVDCGDARLRIDMGNLPVGYMKPAVGKDGNWQSEFGFLLMDGTTRYSCKDYDKLLERLKAWYPESMLNISTAEGETESHFIIPKCTTHTDFSDDNYMQIKAADNGTYEMEKEAPYIRNFGTFEESSEFVTINDNLEGVAYPMIGKYTKTVRNEISEEITTTDVDTSIDISQICALCIKEEKIAEPNIDQLDVHLYVDPDAPHKDGLMHWVEIRNGFHNYNNDTTYGFEWKIEKVEGLSHENSFGTYLLSTDIKDGIGICYQSTGNQAPYPLSGMPYKVVVYKRTHFLRQFDLNGVVSSYITNSVLDATGKPTTTTATTGTAVIDAIENRSRVKLLQAYPASKGVEAQILLGKETDPATIVEIASVEQLPIYSPKGIKFETSLKDGSKEDVKVYLKDNRLSYKEGTTEFGQPIEVPKFGDMETNDLITKGQAEEHIKLDATECTNATKKNKTPVHGMIFGIDGNVDASTIAGIELKTHNSKSISANNAVSEEETNNKSYVPYTLYGTPPISAGGPAYINYKEGYTVNQNLSFGESGISYISEENYQITDNGDVIKNERFHGELGKVIDAKTKGDVQLKTIYNFDQTDDDITFMKGKDAYATLQAKGFHQKSLAKYKDIYGEIINSYTNSSSKNYEVKYEAGTDNLFDNNNKEQTEYVGSALQALYEMPLAFFNYKSDPDWYKKYLGIIVDRVSHMRDNINGDDERNIFTEDELNWDIVDANGDTIANTKDDFSENDNTFHYSEEELKSLKTYLNSITNNSESAQNISTSVGMLLKAAKETQERLLKVESSTFGADATTIPGNKGRITLPDTPDVNPEATHLGLNRLVRAMAIELYGTANPAKDKLAESNDTRSTLSKIDELERSIDGCTFDKNIQTDSSDNLLSEVSSATYPYSIAETAQGGHTNIKTEDVEIVYTPVENGKYKSAVTGKEETADAKDILYLNKSTNEYVSKEEYTKAEEVNKQLKTEGKKEVVTNFDKTTYIKETIVANKNWDPISGRNPVEGEKEDASVHGTWTKVDLEKPQTFNLKEDGTFETNTTTNLVPANEHGRDKFNGVIDAIARICTKVNALTYTVNGVDNIDSTPRRLNTIRQNIETLIKEAYFDGAPETTVVPATESEIAQATTESKDVSRAYSDEDVDKPQPSTPYNEKKGKEYTGISRFDQLSNDLYNYVLNCKDHTELYFSVNSNSLGDDTNDKNHIAIQYTSDDDVNNKGASKKQVLAGRTFNGKKLLIDGTTDSTGANVSDFNRTHVDNSPVTSAHINVPDSIEEYQYASIIDILIDAIGDAHFRKQIHGVNTTDQEKRPTETITDRIEKIESALDNVVRKLSKKTSFEGDTQKGKDDSKLHSGSDTVVYSIEDYIESISEWFGLSVKDDVSKNDEWGQSISAEKAAGYGLEDNDNYLTNANPVVNSNYIIKQLLLRLRAEEAHTNKIDTVIGKEYTDAVTQEISNKVEEGTQEFKTTVAFNLSDDIKDLLLTVYGKDTGSYGAPVDQTDYTHRTAVKPPKYLHAYAWSDSSLGYLYTKVAVPKSGDKAYSNSDLSTNPYNITVANPQSITVDGKVYVRASDNDVSEEKTETDTRFTGNSTDRNIIDDIIKELYFVPSQVTKDNSVDAKADSIDVDYENNFYNLDSGTNKYDYEKTQNDGYGRIGKAIGYNNRGTLFGDFIGNNQVDSKYRRSRLQVLEDQVRHLRSILGLNLTGENKTSVYDSKVAYGGQFGMTGLYELGNYNFDSKATRNGNMYIPGKDAAVSDAGASAKTNIFTVLFNLENAIRDIGRELGTETKYHGDKYDNFEQLNTVRRDGNTIYERLAAVEDITDRLFGVENNHPGRDDESEDDTDGILDIQWIEE